MSDVPAVGDVNSDARGSGARYNKDKAPYRYIPLFLIEGAARVFHKATTRAVNPYPMWNWAKGMPWSVPYECALRHLDKFYRGEDIDADTGEQHIDLAICNLLMLKHYQTAYREGDDRPTHFKPFDLSNQLAAQEAAHGLEATTARLLADRAAPHVVHCMSVEDCTYPSCGCVRPKA